MSRRARLSATRSAAARNSDAAWNPTSRQVNWPPTKSSSAWSNYVSEHKHVKGCIFDGFPRTTVQAEEFDKLLARHGLKVDIMVDIHVPEEELVQRILLRGKDSGRADDASEEVIRGRLDVYRQQTAVVSDYYAARGKYASVNGTGSMEEVFSRITDVIDQLQ